MFRCLVSSHFFCFLQIHFSLQSLVTDCSTVCFQQQWRTSDVSARFWMCHVTAVSASVLSCAVTVAYMPSCSKVHGLFMYGFAYLKERLLLTCIRADTDTDTDTVEGCSLLNCHLTRMTQTDSSSKKEHSYVIMSLNSYDYFVFLVAKTAKYWRVSFPCNEREWRVGVFTKNVNKLIIKIVYMTIFQVF